MMATRRVNLFHRLYPGVSIPPSGIVAMRCPWHDDAKPSLSVNPEKNWVKCHAVTCGRKETLAVFIAADGKRGQAQSTPSTPPEHIPFNASSIAERYIWYDAWGKPIAAQVHIKDSMLAHYPRFMWQRPGIVSGGVNATQTM